MGILSSVRYSSSPATKTIVFPYRAHHYLEGEGFHDASPEERKQDE